MPPRKLTREGVLDTAVAMADAEGLGRLTMRRLAGELGVEAMSLYHHVANKGDLLDGLVDLVMAEIDERVERTAVPGDTWLQAMRRRILSAREVMLQHPWAPRLFETRPTMSLAVVRYHDRLVGLMRAGGFSYDLAHHALHALGSRALGFSQELFDPAASASPASERMLRELADQVPHLTGMMAEIAHDDPAGTIGWCDDQAEFEFALDLLLDGLDRRR